MSEAYACIYRVTKASFNGKIVVSATGAIFFSLKFKFLRLDGSFRRRYFFARKDPRTYLRDFPVPTLVSGPSFMGHGGFPSAE